MRSLKPIVLLSLLTLLFLSCQNNGSIDSVEYWKIPTIKKYDLERYHIIIDLYCDNRFKEVGGNDSNLIEIDYLRVAKMTLYNLSLEEFSEHNNELTFEYFNNNVANNDNILCYLSNQSKANLESNTKLWWQNVNKIIGDIEDLKKVLRSHIQIENKEMTKEAGHIGYNVLYNIDDNMYVICIIVLKKNGGSEIQWLENNSSLIRILEVWDAYER